MHNPIRTKIRAKKLGVLIRDARHTLGKSLDECSQAIGVKPDDFQEYELGTKSPSLPEIEGLALYLQMPVDHFWGEKIISESEASVAKLDIEHLIGLRQRMIGTLLRKARTEANISLREVAEALNIKEDQMEGIEKGELPISLPELEALSPMLNRSIQDFQDQHGPVGVWAEQQRAVKVFLDLPSEIQSFVSKPINQPYIELAQRLSEMSVDKLRAVGEGILEITL
ncbi:MAG: transcriptional regulator [Anaerolineales bacterium]|nr:MAG: transcriptional regulator [Anaerolineales bacterium]